MENPRFNEQDPFNNHDVDESLAVEGLRSAVEEYRMREEKLAGKLDKRVDKISRISAAQEAAENTHRQMNRLLSEHSITDPQEMRAQQTRTRSETPQAPESIFQKGHRKLGVERLIKDIDHDPEVTLDEHPAPGLVDKISQVLSKRRERKIALKRTEQKRNETIFGAGIGLGVKSPLKTAVKKTTMRTQAVTKLVSGESTAGEFVDTMKDIKGHVEHSQTRGVKRATRKERNAAIKADLLARQPVRSRVRKAKISRHEKKARDILDQQSDLSSLRQQAEDEIRRLTREDEDTEA